MDNKKAGIITLIALILVAGYVIYGKKNTSPQNKQNTDEEVEVSAGKILGTVKSKALGEYLTDYAGMTLYVFADDKKLESACDGDCLKDWVPYKWDTTQDFKAMTNSLDKKVNAIKRSDGTRQYAFIEQPVYYYIGDMKPGDVKGNGLGNGKWNIISITE